MSGRLVVIGASPSIAAVAREVDPAAVFLQQPGSPVDEIVRIGCNLYTTDFSRDEELRVLLREVVAPLGVSAVVSVTETGQLPAAVANETLGTTGLRPEVVRRFQDKAVMRQRMAQTVPDLSVRYAVPAGGAEAARRMRAWGAARAVLKPPEGTASRDVRIVADPADLERLDLGAPALLEEFAEGDEYSAETFSTGGTHRLVAVTRKHLFDATVVEAAHVVPAPGLDDGERAMVEKCVARFLDAMELTDGPAHTEFRLRDGEFRIIESHTRIGGDGITRLVQRVTGVDLKRWSLGWSAGLTATDCTTAPEAGAAAIAFVTAPPGRVTAVRVPDFAPQGADVRDVDLYVGPGDEIGELTDSRQRAGHVLATGDDPATVLAAVRDMAARVVVETAR
ncbi:ATP-grasp domain-containing protein [Streptomyces sp. RKND-216]|uniref:ATP-grasp domain-containing protein n=1 Tax=Streptomyces sp. RKND-216 TaxID=2562581 RepID=UPI00109DD9D3|nr:ATP-grasp domain-containing protein [Streptomyces sp. RKND-216]THA23924.1 ATP-grasp domain-containing protein [Streptomyces sp. RKND-216]